MRDNHPFDYNQSGTADPRLCKGGSFFVPIYTLGGNVSVFNRLKQDIQVIRDRDPAAKNTLEILLCYAGLHAIWAHRLSHFLYLHKWFVTARLISSITRFFTGIEIHPGAQIGAGLFIDHGTGIVIGETTIIGNNVSLYQGVTLGGTEKEKGKRHPTIKDCVVIASGAKVLGSFTVGEGAKIVAGSVVLHEVPPYSTVIGIPGHVVMQHGKRVGRTYTEQDIDLEHNQLPDPIEDEIRELKQQIAFLQQRLNDMNTTEHTHIKKLVQHK